MKTHFHSFKGSLLVVAACTTMLSACSRGEIINKISGEEGRQEQVIDGPRRSPQLNPKREMKVPPIPQNLPPAVQNAPAQKRLVPSIAPVQFNQHSDHAPTKNAKTKPDRPDASLAVKSASEYFSNIFSGGKKNTKNVIRKPIAGNRNIGKTPEIAHEAPVFEPVAKPSLAPSPTPIMQISEEQDRSVPEFKPVVKSYPVASDMDEPLSKEVEKAKIKKVEVNKEQKKPRASFFSRLMSPITGGGDEVDSVQGKKHPKLSSVPATPETFNKVKGDKQEQMQTLQMDHNMAQESKELLASEPSQLQPEPSMKMLDKPAIAPKSGQPVLLGEVGDSSIKRFEPVKPVPVKEATKPVVTKPVVTKKTPPAKKGDSWWSRITSRKDDSKVVVKKEAKEVEAPVVPSQPVAAPLLDEPVPSSVAPFKPTNVQIPRLAAPVEYADDIADKKQENGLPSPQILRKVKTLPPSRYKARERKYYLVP